jgi:hypothetical protein
MQDHSDARAHAYGLPRILLRTAVHDELSPAEPRRIAGAGAIERAKTIRWSR